MAAPSLNVRSFSRSSMPALGQTVDGVEYGCPTRFQGLAHRFVLAKRAHFTLATDGRSDHERIETQLAQSGSGFLHLGGPALPVACHALEVVIGELGPIERWIIVLQRCRHFLE